MSKEERFAFLTEWYDSTAALQRRYQLMYYPKDGSVEMFDVKNQRTFLRRTVYDDIQQDDLFLGNRVTVFSRQLHLIEYADQYTANKLGIKKERTLAILKPDVVTKIGDFLELIYSSNLIVTKAKMSCLTCNQAADFYAEHQSKPFFNNLVQYVSSGPLVAMELMGTDAVSAWRRLLGPTDSPTRRESPQNVRSQMGAEGIKNVGHGSDSLAAAARELEFFFPSTVGLGPGNTARCTDCTCCIIKPHAMSEGLAGKILNSISKAGFEITALQMFHVERANAEEFLEVYKGVVTEYSCMVSELCSGPCMVLEIHGNDVPKRFREFCGPADPEIARHLYPTTLRALYGKTKVRNAVHCTDLPEDGVLEVGTVPHSESKRIVFSDVLLGTPTLLRVCMCLLQLHNTFPPDCLSAYARVRCSSLAQEQNPSQLCEAGSHDSAPWAGATLDHTGFQGNKNGRGI
ncbi:nucleoside diphosphate kinase homolog 7 isoform X2 [Cynoglossus semilaevis]|nr:nucleoside diphosphate kinase 7 isoform X2 [Cynoglossus semilaevis]XP_024921366.1 nucleoside diphosphate kinase 7 isoform X2 [Cynoglossus semilaevis]